MVEHLSGYQKRDREIVDYGMYSLGSTELWFRGPPKRDLPPGGYIVCLGAAQTFGCLCDKPFPQLLEAQTGLPVLNLGYGGAGPEFFVKHAALLPFIQNARLVVVQVMSGRSVTNSKFESGGLEYLRRRSDGVRLSAETAYDHELSAARGEMRPGINLLPWRVCRRLLREWRLMPIRRLVRETRRNWVRANLDLLARIRVPAVLFWFSRRTCEYRPSYHSAVGLFGEFPQFVVGSMVRTVARHASRYVECITSRGTPQPLRSRFTGLPVSINPADDRPDFGSFLMSHNNYYPTPEMHEDAAAALAPVCRSLWTGSPT